MIISFAAIFEDRFYYRKMLSEVYNKSTEEVFETPIVQQTSFWSEVKRKLGVNSYAFNFKVKMTDIHHDNNDDENVLSDLLIVLEYIDKQHCVAYVPYGPELEPDPDYQGVFLEELSECIRPYLPEECIAIRYDLFWESPYAKDDDFFDEKGFWTGPPEHRIQELRFNFNTIKWNFQKSFSNILPSNTNFINLEKKEDDLLAAMKPKTRYNIRLSERKGVKVKTLGLEDMDVWYKLYEETTRRNGIYLHDPEYFRAVFTARANCTCSPAKVLLLVAEYDEKPLAAMFLVLSQKRAIYLYGASSLKNRNLMAPYALQWEAMRIAKAKGCIEYDMFGVSPRPDPDHPMYGLYRFKTGFGGTIYHSMGCWDYPLDNETYTHFKSWEINQKGYHLS